MAAADDGDLLAGKLHLAEQNVLNIIDIVAVGAGDSGDDLIAAAGDHDAVRLDRLNARDRARRVEVHLDAVFLHLGDLRVHKFLRHVLARRLGGKNGAAAERAARFKDHGLEAALFHQQGRLHTGRAAADDGDLAAVAVFDELVIAKRDLVAGDGVERAVQRAARDDGLVAVHAAEALADEILAPGHGLLHKIGVGNVHAGHADKVAHPLLQELLGKLRMLDGVDRDDRNADLALDGLDKAASPALGAVAGLDHGRRARVHAAADVEVIDIRLQVLGDLDAGILVVAALDEVVAVDARADNEAGLDDLTDALQDAHDKAAAVFHGAAVFVGAFVRVGAHKLLQQVAVRAVDLHAVGAGGLRIERGLNEEADQPVNVLNGHLARQDRVAADHAVELHARRHGLAAAVDRRGRFASAVVQLDKDLGAVAVHGVADALKARDLACIPDAELNAVAVTAVRIDRRELRDDEAAAALSALLIEPDLLRRGAAVPIAEHRAHGRHDDAVAQLEPADGSLFK